MSEIVSGVLGDTPYVAVSLDDVRAFCKIPANVTAPNTVLDDIREGVYDHFKTELGVVFESQWVVDEKHNIYNNRQDRINTEYFPIIQIQALTNDATAVDSDDYQILKKQGTVILTDDYWTEDYAGAVITYQAGWAEADFPSDIKLYMMMLCKAIWDEDYANKSTFSEKTGRTTIVAKASETGISTMIERLATKYGNKGM